MNPSTKQQYNKGDRITDTRQRFSGTITHVQASGYLVKVHGSGEVAEVRKADAAPAR